MVFFKDLTLSEKLKILADAAKYDVSCTSSGVGRKGKKGFLGNSAASGICHSFSADGRCISLLKILLTNHCIYDCKYCINRCSNDVVRTAFTPQEICQLTMEFYKRNYIEGLFLSSGICKNPAYTMEQICQTLLLLRETCHFNGYIHVKAIPGAPAELLTQAGLLADRMSINLELPSRESLSRLAPNKSQSAILRPMRLLSNTISQNRLALGKDSRMERSRTQRDLPDSIFSGHSLKKLSDDASALSNTAPVLTAEPAKNKESLSIPSRFSHHPFVPAGQSTQMIIGASPESDYHLLRTTQYLYQNYDLKRVFYSAYVPKNEDSALPSPDTPVPLLREHRLYQADWLLRFYGFQADELLSEQSPNFNEQLDPKCDWALRHLDQFPVEINQAPLDVLLRVPGIGPKSAYRIAAARRQGSLDFTHLKKIGVVLKRAHYFITCSGHMLYPVLMEPQYLTRQLADLSHTQNWKIQHPEEASYRQMSVFDYIS